MNKVRWYILTQLNAVLVVMPVDKDSKEFGK